MHNQLESMPVQFTQAGAKFGTAVVPGVPVPVNSMQ
jgi:hypothetical protein